MSVMSVTAVGAVAAVIAVNAATAQTKAHTYWLSLRPTLRLHFGSQSIISQINCFSVKCFVLTHISSLELYPMIEILRRSDGNTILTTNDSSEGTDQL